MQLSILVRKELREKLILPIKGWVASLKKGGTITLALKSENPRCYVGVKTAEVLEYAEDETCATAYAVVDMGEELTDDLLENRVKVVGWKGTSDPKPAPKPG